MIETITISVATVDVHATAVVVIDEKSYIATFDLVPQVLTAVKIVKKSVLV